MEYPIGWFTAHRMWRGLWQRAVRSMQTRLSPGIEAPSIQDFKTCAVW
jgi:hypothetical protein